MQKTLMLVIGIILLAILGFAGFYYFSNQNKPLPASSPTPTATPNVTTTPSPQVQEPALPSNWVTYKDSVNGYEISYPNNYKALYDKDNLSGWPNAVLLIYSGGQSYDLPIEVWNTAAEYQAKYPSNTEGLTVKEVGGKFITLVNTNKSAEVDEIIATFKALK